MSRIPGGVFSRIGATLLVAAAAPAAVIDFEDLEAANDSRVLVRNEYAHMGATFAPSDDGATWAGMGAGDPGGWQIAGTNGSTFLGFDGSSYATTLNFDAPVENFQLDVSRAAGGSAFYLDYFQLTGFLDGRIVASSAAYFGSVVGAWQTVALDGPVDRVVWFGTGLFGFRYGVDNLQWLGGEPEAPEVPEEPEELLVEIDVHPGSDRNPINLKSKGVVPVVLYGAEDFEVEQVDVETLALGEAPIAHRNGPHFGDVDGDGWLDLVSHHRVQEIGLQAGDEDTCLTGLLLDGTEFAGCDAVTLVGR